MQLPSVREPAPDARTPDRTECVCVVVVVWWALQNRLCLLETGPNQHACFYARGPVGEGEKQGRVDI